MGWHLHSYFTHLSHHDPLFMYIIIYNIIVTVYYLTIIITTGGSTLMYFSLMEKEVLYSGTVLLVQIFV